MSYFAIKVAHLFGVILAFLALGGLAVRALDGATGKSRGSKIAGMTHGIALLLVLLSGFAMLGMHQLGFPLWAWLKLAVWLALGAVLVLLRRMPQHAAILWLAIPLLGALAAYLALFKPGL